MPGPEQLDPLEREVTRTLFDVLANYENQIITAETIPSIIQAVIDDAQLELMSTAGLVKALGRSRTSGYKIIGDFEESHGISVEGSTDKTSKVYLKKDAEAFIELNRQKEAVLNGFWKEQVRTLNT